MTTKILALTDALGNLVKFVLMPGQRHDTKGVKELIADVRFEALLADKVFDVNWLIQELGKRGAQVVISQMPRRRAPLEIDREVYKWRHLIENFFGKLKEFKRIAIRSDKTDSSFAAMIYLAAGVINSRRFSTRPRLRQAFPTMLAAIDDMVSRLIPLADGSPWQADAAMSHVTADIIYRTILSKPLSQAQANQIHADFTAYQHYAQRVMGLSALRLPTWYHRARCRNAAASIRATFADVVHQRFSSVQAATTDGPQDMLDALIKACDPDTGATLTEEGLVDQVGTLFLAGHETSASTLAWALYLLACQPQWQQRLREQVWALWPGAATPAFGDSRQLHGLHDLFRETLRLYPPIAFYVRQARQDECLRDKPVPAGSLVEVSSWLVQRHSGFWEDPAVFDPARFGTAAGQQSAKHAYLPFGLGPRACPGAAFATQESIL